VRAESEQTGFNIIAYRNLLTFAASRHHGLFCRKSSEYGSRALHHLSREFHPLSIHKATHRNPSRLPRWLLVDAQVTPTDDPVQGTYISLPSFHRIYHPTLDIHAKHVGSIQRGERPENTSRH